MHQVNNARSFLWMRRCASIRKSLQVKVKKCMEKAYTGKRKKLSKRGKIVLVIVCVSLLMGTCATLFVTGYRLANSYHLATYQAQTGTQHLRNAETLLKTVPEHPFDGQTATRAQQEFSSALSSFTGLNTTLATLPGAVSWFPSIAAPLHAASHLVPLAISGSQAGVSGCQLLTLLINTFHNLSSAQGELKAADIQRITWQFQLFSRTLDKMAEQFRQVQPSDLQLEAHLGAQFATLRQQLPTIQHLLTLAGQFLSITPALLGVSAPAHYLLEILDSTEIRPGGGFVGNYGIVTFAGGHLVSAPITDTTLLDRPFETSGGTIPFPSAYSWFDLAPTWSLRDSNLDADFPTAARYAEQNYQKEGGKGTFQGVIAITPVLIQQVLEITGPISVPEYKQTVTAQNLISLIHYYQLVDDKGNLDVPSSDGYSSERKHFTALLAKHLLDRLHSILPTTLPRFVQLLQNAIQTKDIQVYFNASQAEQMLHSYQWDASIQSVPGDGLFIVDANIAASKANPLITSSLKDQVTLDAQGNATHQTTISYAWATSGSTYGNALYRDYVRVYVAPGSTLLAQHGWQPRGVNTAFGHVVWAGFFTLTAGQKLTVTLRWVAHTVAKKVLSAWSYHYLIQRQAGTKWTFDLQVNLPSCATISQVEGGLITHTKQSASITHSLDANTYLGVKYSC